MMSPDLTAVFWIGLTTCCAINHWIVWTVFSLVLFHKESISHFFEKKPFVMEDIPTEKSTPPTTSSCFSTIVVPNTPITAKKEPEKNQKSESEKQW